MTFDHILESIDWPSAVFYVQTVYNQILQSSLMDLDSPIQH